MHEKPDFYSKKAKNEGYPARSVYKLEEIDRKFRLFRPGMCVLDAGAAPGSWSIYVAGKIKSKGRLVAVDLQDIDTAPFDRLDDFFFLQGDLTEDAVRKELTARGPYDIVVSDAAPATTGNRTVDTGRSFALVSKIIDIAELHLKPGGSLVVKIFQGGDEGQLLHRMKSLFKTVKAFKPQASRKISFETYFIGTDRKS